MKTRIVKKIFKSTYHHRWLKKLKRLIKNSIKFDNFSLKEFSHDLITLKLNK